MGDEEDPRSLPAPFVGFRLASALDGQPSSPATANGESAGTEGGQSTNAERSTSSTTDSTGAAAGSRTTAQALQALASIGLRPPRQFDNKKENDFRSWVKRLERFMALANLPVDRFTSMLLMHLGSEPFTTARCLGIMDSTVYKDARTRLIQHDSPQEEPVELRSRFQLRMQEANEPLENFSRDLRVLAARAFPKATQEMLDVLMVHQFVQGLRDGET